MPRKVTPRRGYESGGFLPSKTHQPEFSPNVDEAILTAAKSLSIPAARLAAFEERLQQAVREYSFNAFFNGQTPNEVKALLKETQVHARALGDLLGLGENSMGEDCLDWLSDCLQEVRPDIDKPHRFLHSAAEEFKSLLSTVELLNEVLIKAHANWKTKSGGPRPKIQIDLLIQAYAAIFHEFTGSEPKTTANGKFVRVVDDLLWALGAQKAGESSFQRVRKVIAKKAPVKKTGRRLR